MSVTVWEVWHLPCANQLASFVLESEAREFVRALLAEPDAIPADELSLGACCGCSEPCACVVPPARSGSELTAWIGGGGR